MIRLDVTLDATLVRRLHDGGRAGLAAAWTDFCDRHSLTDLRRFDDMFGDGPEPTAATLSALRDRVAYLDEHLKRSIEHVARFLPEVDDDIAHHVTVALLPGGQYTFGPQPGLQLFSLDPAAAPAEIYLFLVHVYYHELSDLNDTPRGRRCSVEQPSAGDFKEWIRLLVRNEGIGNYAVLDDLRRFRDRRSDYVFRYFTYARKLGDPALLGSAVSLLANALTGVDDGNVAQFRDGINRIFKNEALPIINLVGTHMAESIARHHGAAALRNVYRREAGEFFALYGETAAPFAPILREL